MKKSTLLLTSIAWVSLLHADDKIAKNELLKLYTSHRQVATGVGRGGSLFAMQAPFGRYLLFRRNDELLAVIITKHPKPRAAEFRWHWFKGQERKQGSGKFDEIAGPRTLTVQSFKLVWSAGDWFYFPDAELQMARSEITEVEEIQDRAAELDWHNRSRFLNSEKEEVDKLRKGLGIDMSPEPDGPANRSQPVQLGTSSTPLPAGSGR